MIGVIYFAPMPSADVYSEGGGSVFVDYYSLFVVALIVCGGVFEACFVVGALCPLLVLQSSSWGNESGLLYINCFPDVL